MSNLKFDFSGENFVVTGASSGMGRQIAIELAEAGANVLAIARRKNELEKLQDLYPNKIFIAAIDVCNSNDVETAINDFVGKYGKLNGAVYAAGISLLTPLKGYEESESRKIMEINYWGGVNLIQICSKVKISHNNASFVLFSSVRANHTEKGLFAYASAKAAVQVAVKTFAKELSKRKLRLNTISPGFVKTNMTNDLMDSHNLEEVIQNTILGVGEPNDVSGTVLFLLSDRANWITGTDIIVDGGYLA